MSRSDLGTGVLSIVHTCHTVAAALHRRLVGIQQIAVPVKHEVVDWAAIVHSRYAHLLYIALQLDDVQHSNLRFAW